MYCTLLHILPYAWHIIHSHKRIPMKFIITLLCSILFTGCSFFSPSHFNTEDHTFKSNGLTFTGTLYTPKTAPPYPLIVIAHGAGDSKRSFSAYTHYGEYFSANGVAVFIFDKRGVGDSEGNYIEGEIYFDSLAEDLSAAFTFASHLPVIKQRSSGILGISQAGWVIPLALQRIDSIAFVVNISGPSVPPYYSDNYYKETELRNDGFSEDDIREIVEYNRTISRYVGTFTNRESALAIKAQFKDKPWFKKLGYKESLSPEDTLRLPAYDHYRRAAFDPEPFWNKPSLPVLCLFGDKDAHIPVDTIAKRFDMIFNSKQFSDYTIKRFPNGGHILQQVDAPRESIKHDPISMIFKGFPKPTDESMIFLEKWIKERVK